MKIKLNNKLYEINAETTLISFIENLGINLQGIAIAINHEVIPKNLWSDTVLTDGMDLMLIHAVAGG